MILQSSMNQKKDVIIIDPTGNHIWTKTEYLCLFFISHHFSKEKEGNIDTDVRAESTHEHSNSCHVDIDRTGHQNGPQCDSSPTNHERIPSSPVVNEEGYDEVPNKGPKVDKTAEHIN